MTKQGRDEPRLFPFGVVKEGVPNTRSPWLKAFFLSLSISLPTYQPTYLAIDLFIRFFVSHTRRRKGNGGGDLERAMARGLLESASPPPRAHEEMPMMM
jgi:hypothetical protein